MTRFEEIAGQSHDLKAGVEFEATATTDRLGHNGGMIVSPVPRFGITVFSVWDGETDETSSRRGGAYVQDRWSLHDRVTLNLGVRLDINRAAVPVQGTLFSTNPISPRAGVAWALTADHATVVRAHYGRYHDSTMTRTIRDLDTTDQNDRIIEVELPTGQRIEAVRFPPPAVNTSVDRDIRHSYVDQYVIGFERELVPDVSMQVQYVWRKFEQFMGMIDTNTEWTPEQVRDPGPDGELDSGDDGGLFTIYRPSLGFVDRRFLYTNPEGAFRRYDALQLIGKKRYSDNWQMQASYTWSRSRANVGNDESTNAGRHELDLRPIAGVFNSPNGRINSEGEAPWTISELKILGTYRVPAWGGINVSGIYRYHSGRRWGRYFLTDEPLPFAVRAEPRGTRRLPAVASLDLRVEKTFGVLGTPGGIGLFVDVFNLTNEGAATFVDAQSGRGFGEFIAWTDPRTVRAGLRYTF